MMPPPELKQKIPRTYMWRPLSASGCERGELLTSGNNWILQGTIIRWVHDIRMEVESAFFFCSLFLSAYIR